MLNLQRALGKQLFPKDISQITLNNKPGAACVVTVKSCNNRLIHVNADSHLLLQVGEVVDENKQIEICVKRDKEPPFTVYGKLALLGSEAPAEVKKAKVVIRLMNKQKRSKVAEHKSQEKNVEEMSSSSSKSQDSEDTVSTDSNPEPVSPEPSTPELPKVSSKNTSPRQSSPSVPVDFDVEDAMERLKKEKEQFKTSWEAQERERAARRKFLIEQTKKQADLEYRALLHKQSFIERLERQEHELVSLNDNLQNMEQEMAARRKELAAMEAEYKQAKHNRDCLKESIAIDIAKFDALKGVCNDEYSTTRPSRSQTSPQHSSYVNVLKTKIVEERKSRKINLRE